jgi:predicted DNA-binding transcriptional regulator AlpA
MQLLTERETAERLRCTEAALRRWRRERRGPRWVKLGRLVRYKEGDLEAFIEQSTETPKEKSKVIAFGL